MAIQIIRDKFLEWFYTSSLRHVTFTVIVLYPLTCGLTFLFHKNLAFESFFCLEIKLIFLNPPRYTLSNPLPAPCLPIAHLVTRSWICLSLNCHLLFEWPLTTVIFIPKCSILDDVHFSSIQILIVTSSFHSAPIYEKG